MSKATPKQSESYFFDEQARKNTRLRILHDAELIKGGATINELGRLVVTHTQLKHFESLNEPDNERERWLDKSVTSLLEQADTSESDQQKVSDALLRNGVATVKMLVIAGSGRIGGIAGSEELLGVLLQNDFGIEFEETYLPAAAAKYTRNLEQINARLVTSVVKPNVSVAEILASQPDDVEKMLDMSLLDNVHTLAECKRIARTVQKECLKFKAEYDIQKSFMP